MTWIFISKWRYIAITVIILWFWLQTSPRSNHSSRRALSFDTNIYIHYNEYLFEFKNARSACGNLFPHIKQITFSMCSTPIPLIHLFDSRSTKLESIRAFVLRVCRYVYSHTKIQYCVWLLTNVFFSETNIRFNKSNLQQCSLISTMSANIFRIEFSISTLTNTHGVYYVCV